MPKKKKSPLKQTGITPEGAPVYAGAYKFYETYGLPLDALFIAFQDKGWVPDWTDFYLGALAAGMQHDRIISKLEEAISDSFGKEWSDAVILRLNKTFQPQEPLHDQRKLHLP